MNHPARRRPLALSLLTALTLTVCGCGGSSDTSTPTTPSFNPTPTTESFGGSIGQNGTAIHPFPVTTGGYTLMAGYTSLSPAPQTSLGLGIGTWDATTYTCSLNQIQNDAAKSGSTALSGTASAGNWCLRAYDGGNIPSGVTVSYVVQVQHY